MDRADEGELIMASPRNLQAPRGMIIAFGFIVFFAAVAFGVKIYEFLTDLLDDGGIGFAGSHLLTYVLVAAGFILLLVHAFISGHFAAIEEPKHTMLEKEIARDDADELV